VIVKGIRNEGNHLFYPNLHHTPAQ